MGSLTTAPSCLTFRNMSIRIHITEAAAERMADQMVMRRLANDAEYQAANDSDAQQEREDEISVEVWGELEDRYEIL